MSRFFKLDFWGFGPPWNSFGTLFGHQQFCSTTSQHSSSSLLPTWSRISSTWVCTHFRVFFGKWTCGISFLPFIFYTIPNRLNGLKVKFPLSLLRFCSIHIWPFLIGSFGIPRINLHSNSFRVRILDSITIILLFKNEHFGITRYDNNDLTLK